MARNSTERLCGEYDLESRGSAFPRTPVRSRSQHSPSEHLQCSIILALRGVVFLHDSL